MVYVSVLIPEMVWKKIQFNRVYMEIPKIPRPIATYIIDGNHMKVFQNEGLARSHGDA